MQTLFLKLHFDMINDIIVIAHTNFCFFEPHFGMIDIIFFSENPGYWGFLTSTVRLCPAITALAPHAILIS